MKKALPLDDLRWVPLTEAHAELSKRMGSGAIAAKALTEKMAKEQIRSMRWRVGGYPPGPERELVSGAFWRDEYELHSGNRLHVDPRVRTSRQIVDVRYFVFYVWGPDFKKIFSAVAAPAEKPKPRAQEVPAERGRKRVHERADLQAAALGLALQRKLSAPEKKPTDVVNELREWCKRDQRKVPADSTLYDIVAAALRIKRTLKP